MINKCNKTHMHAFILTQANTDVRNIYCPHTFETQCMCARLAVTKSAVSVTVAKHW